MFVIFIYHQFTDGSPFRVPRKLASRTLSSCSKTCTRSVFSARAREERKHESIVKLPLAPSVSGFNAKVI